MIVKHLLKENLEVRSSIFTVSSEESNHIDTSKGSGLYEA